MGVQEPRILVVGAGPVGLTLGIELRRHGLDCRLIEQMAAAHHQSRATDLHARTLEAFYDMELHEPMVAKGHRRHGIQLVIDGKLVLEYSLADQDTPFSFDVGLPQCDIESVLHERLSGLGGKVDRGVRLATLQPDPEGATATLLMPDGRWTEERFDWVIACDGARSAVRRSLEVLLEGSTFEEAFFLVDAELETKKPRDSLCMTMSHKGMVCFLPMPGEKSYRIFGELDVGVTPPSPLTIPFLQEIVDARSGTGNVIRSMGWNAVFRVHTRMVKEYRYGRVFLAGDAAHIHSPIGGNGMNTGIQDAYNLAWKLALVAKGKARDELLDTYYPERAPIARAVLDDTDSSTRMFTSRSPVVRELLSRAVPLFTKLPPARRRAVIRAMELGVNYRESPHVDEYVDSVLAVHVFSDRNSEQASISERMDFAHAPQPGDHAPNVALEGNGHPSLHALFRGTSHTLLLFDGDATTDAGYDGFNAIAGEIDRRYRGLIDTYVVVQGSERPARLDRSVAMITDKSRALHQRYGAAKECAYLVRPDGYVGFRSQPAVQSALTQYLERWLIPSA
jgi:2-polyprenyl-6-methoxyphenol hydroxylase-like FAD-dependent oxidoreductase